MGAALGRRKRSISAKTGGEEGAYRGAWVTLAALAALVTGILLGFGWSLDQQLQTGLLAQRAQAAAAPDWIALEELPDYLPLAFGAAADPTFQIRGSAGEAGTPISRHLIAQVYMLDNDHPRSFARGTVLAGRLEQRMSTDAVTELFLNRARLGTVNEWPIIGVQQAAREYFGKSAPELTLGEAATLAGLLLSPRLHNPERYPGPAGARRNEILRRLHLDERITDQELMEATRERLGFQPGLAHRPMTRPPGWDRPDEEEVIRLPAAPLEEDDS